MSHADPLSPLTPREEEMIEKLSRLPRPAILQRLKEDLQTAAWIELATIPIYLYTYYSIQRAERSGENVRPCDLFANKAGGVIMSVAVEEMLHMSLACNILHSLGVDPQLYGKSPASYPTPLPYHNPVGPPGPHGGTRVRIPLAKLTYEQLWHFLQIEYPESVDAWPEDRNWNTIGQFYSYVRCLIKCPQVRDEDFQVRGRGAERYQIQPYNYSPNNVDTAHPKERFDPWGIPGRRGRRPNAADVARFSNAPDSHTGPSPLITVSSRRQALEAIDTICDQGEGFAHRPTDDPSHAEDSHYYKFLKLQAQLEQYPHHVEKLPPLPKPPAPIKPAVTAAELAEVIVNFPDNPTSKSYAEYYDKSPGSRVNYRPLSDLINGVYQYMLIMTETVFKVGDAGPEKGGQKLFFNQGMHFSMIWILDKLIQKMRLYTLDDGHAVAPTFENLDLGTRQEAHAGLVQLADAVSAEPYYQDLEYYVDMIKNRLPDVSGYWQSGPQPGQPVPVPYPYKDAPPWPTEIGPQPEGLPLHACMGLNSCRASDRFGTKGHEDPGRPGTYVVNECAGQGYCSTAADHTCLAMNECRNQGGCGLYGTAEDQARPGVNECKSLGSCATPINAERFSTNGPNKRKSVWKRARAVFEENWPELRKKIPEAPQKLGPVPAPFADVGPPYLWISDDNEERTHMTACGASGLSGAGGCV